MKMIWKQIDLLNMTQDVKWKLCLLITGAAACCIGLAVWAVVRLFALQSVGWALVFGGYPMLAAWLATIVYCGRHEFHCGSSRYF